MFLRYTLPLFLLLPALAFATHNRGGEIIVRAGEGRTACATIITFTETAQTEVDRESLDLDWGDGTVETLIRTAKREVAPGIQRNEYSRCHAYPTFGRYVLSFADVNRVRNVRNLPQSVNIPFSVQTTFTLLNAATAGGANSTPVFTVDPVGISCVGSAWTHAAGAYDPDGDSLSFHFTVPTDGRDQEVRDFVLPHRVAGGNGPLTIDPRSGQITWDAPAIAGEYTLAFAVVAHRAGVPLDTVVRDLTIFVDDCQNAPPVIDLHAQDYQVAPGETLELAVTATGGAAEAQAVTLTAHGLPLGLSESPATFTDSREKAVATTVRKTLRWTPTAAHARAQPYLLVLQASDDGDPRPAGMRTLRTVLLYVTAQATEGPSATHDRVAESLPVILYPNPAAGHVTLALPTDGHPYSASLYGPTGRVARTWRGISGSSSLSLHRLPAGVYALVVRDGDRIAARRRLVVR